MSTATVIHPAPANLEGWMACFDEKTLPVLAETAATIEELRLIEEQVDAHLLSESIGSDPLMTLKVLAHVAGIRRPRETSAPETLTAALVLLGIGPFFRNFGPQPTVEDQLGHWPEALEGFHRVLRRSHRAANFAAGFGVHRMDHDVAVIQEAALLHDFAELLLWVHAPALALEIAARQQADPTLRSAEVQRKLLHVELAELQHALMLEWRLPPLLVHIAHDRGRVDPQTQTARLAIRLARHSANGWDNAALPDDLREIGELLLLGPDATRQLIENLDA